MSDENPGAASSPEPMIPKSRLDELIARERQAREQVQFLQGMVTQQQRAQRPTEQPDPEIEKLREENPTLYKVVQRNRELELDIKKVRAGFASVADQTDRSEFLRDAGKEGQKYLAKVEQILASERQRGNFNADRKGIYVYIKGQESLQKESTPAAPRDVPVATADTGDFPSTDARSATTIPSSTAATRTVEKTREERIKELENIVF